MPEAPGPNVRQRRVARRLRAWRTATGQTQDEVGKKLGWSGPKLSRFERADQFAGPAEVIAIATILGVSEAERDHLVSLAVAGAQLDGWWRSYGPETVRGDFEDFIETEADAAAVFNVEIMVVPGLLQTADYANAILSSSLDQPDEELLRSRSQLRHQRQARLDEPEPLHLHAIVHESVLRLPVNGADVMREQLQHLLTRTAQPNVTLQVLPTSIGAYPGMGTAYHLIHFDNSEAPAVYLDNLTDGLYIEDEADVAGYTLNFERLREAALDPDESTKLIERIRKEWT